MIMQFQANIGQGEYSSRFALTWFLTFTDCGSEFLYQRSHNCSQRVWLLPVGLVLAVWSSAPFILPFLCALWMLTRWRQWPGSDLLLLSFLYCALFFARKDLSTEAFVIVLYSLGMH